MIEDKIIARLAELRKSRDELIRQVEAHNIAIGELEHILEADNPSTVQPAGGVS